MRFDYPAEKKKGGKKSKKGTQKSASSQAVNLMGNFQNGLSAGEKFLTPSIEYYKNVANQYKKTLSTLSIN